MNTKRFVCFVFLVSFVVRAAAQDVTDAALVAASATLSIRLGEIGSGRVSPVPLELYVARVLAGEAEPRAPDAAQQALAIAIRTFSIANAGRHRREGFDLCDSTHCQVLRAPTAITRRTALATAGRILTFNGEPADVFYSASCGGHSERASLVWPGVDYPYLRAAEDDAHDGEGRWRVELRLPEVERALRRAGWSGRLRDVEVEGRSDSGRVTVLRVDGLRPPTITGQQFRLAVGANVVRSTAFDLDTDRDRLRFSGRGYGHGVGLCVIGAGRRAQRGETVEAILAQYFPGLRVTALTEQATRRPAIR
jgi:stage II sporulation protein D